MYTYKTDYLIIGGGILGTTAAYLLSKIGKEVILVEKDFIGSGSTGLSAGTILCIGNGKIEDYNYNMKTKDLIIELKNKGFSSDYLESGALQIGLNLNEKDFLEKQYNYLINNNHNQISFIDSNSEIKKLEPNLNNNVLAAIYSPLSCHVNPMKLAKSFSDASLENGSIIFENTKAIDINLNKDKTFTTNFNNNLEIISDSILITTGFGLNNFKNIKLPKINYIKGQIWKTEKKPLGYLNNIIFTSGSYLFWNSNNTNPSYCTHQNNKQLIDHAYGKQNLDGTIIFGGDRIPMKSVNYTEDLKSLNRNKNYVSTFLPNLYSDEFWTGIMPFSNDGKPICKQLYPNLWFIGGFGPNGIMQGPGFIHNWIKNKLKLKLN